MLSSNDVGKALGWESRQLPRRGSTSRVPLASVVNTSLPPPQVHNSEHTADVTHTSENTEFHWHLSWTHLNTTQQWKHSISISLESFVLIWIETLESLQCTSCKQNWSNYFHENMKTIVFMSRANIWVVILVSSMICAKQKTFVKAEVPGSTNADGGSQSNRERKATHGGSHN